MPVNLLRAGRIFVFEPPPGVKANMLRTFSSIPVSRICKVKIAVCVEARETGPSLGPGAGLPASWRHQNG